MSMAKSSYLDSWRVRMRESDRIFYGKINEIRAQMGMPLAEIPTYELKESESNPHHSEDFEWRSLEVEEGITGFNFWDSRDEQVGSRTLLVKIHSEIYPISCEELDMVFSRFGVLENLERLGTEVGYHSKVCFKDKESALRALNLVNGKDIYDGCCRLELILMCSLSVEPSCGCTSARFSKLEEPDLLLEKMNFLALDDRLGISEGDLHPLSVDDNGGSKQPEFIVNPYVNAQENSTVKGIKSINDIVDYEEQETDNDPAKAISNSLNMPMVQTAMKEQGVYDGVLGDSMELNIDMFVEMPSREVVQGIDESFLDTYDVFDEMPMRDGIRMYGISYHVAYSLNDFRNGPSIDVQQYRVVEMPHLGGRYELNFIFDPGIPKGMTRGSLCAQHLLLELMVLRLLIINPRILQFLFASDGDCSLAQRVIWLIAWTIEGYL